MQQNETSQTDWQAFKEFEERKHREFFLPTYKRLKMEVLEDHGREKKPWETFTPFDVKVRYQGKILMVDEKVRTYQWKDFAVEVLQCMKTGRLGWLYSPIHYVFYAVWPSIHAEGDPAYAYMVRLPDLRDFVAANFSKLEDIVSEKGYGISLNKKVEWYDLEYLKLATKIV